MLSPDTLTSKLTRLVGVALEEDLETESCCKKDKHSVANTPC